MLGSASVYSGAMFPYKFTIDLIKNKENDCFFVRCYAGVLVVIGLANPFFNCKTFVLAVIPVD